MKTQTVLLLASFLPLRAIAKGVVSVCEKIVIEAKATLAELDKTTEEVSNAHR